jgi:hypothetical protein
MFLIALGGLLIVVGIVLMASQTASRGEMSARHEASPGSHADTLEPEGRGSQLSFKTDLPGFVLMAIGAALIFLGAFA